MESTRKPPKKDLAFRASRVEVQDLQLQDSGPRSLRFLCCCLLFGRFALNCSALGH